ncbi:DNA-binding transcriptional regulator, LysR family [Pseudomonas sp. NFACC02]|uniref:LysR substrate-binding domain-containing protein n=1 Tax=Pseudomonas sp. NFACC02 TaxID=1566250 RepID=UPI0008D71096|nr:LysR family transcriptional regulator [Pseudomonas sp. NFACC02]SEQ00355.1 DNA-binding transcriptional regulator, LysR family [Pseudomonas sp. NFACC02]
MDYFTAVKAFIQVVEAGSFVKAAQTLNLPRNTVTKHIQSLESHLRVKLLNRTTRRISLTNDGTAYYERMVRVVDQWLEAESDLVSTQARPHGRLRVDMGSTMATMLVLPALPDFQKRYPELQLDIGVSDRPVDLLGDRVDCVIRGGTLSDPSLIARRLGSLEFVTCASPAYLAAHGTPLHPSDLETNHQMVRYFFAGTHRRLPVEFVRGGERISVDANYFVSVNDSNALIAAALAGMGVLQTLMFMAEPHFKSGALVQLLEDWSLEPNPIYIVYSPNRHLSARVRVFAEWLVGLFEAKGLR